MLESGSNIKCEVHKHGRSINTVRAHKERNSQFFFQNV